MNQITSKDNKIFRSFEQLLQKKYRDQRGEYLIEGENLIVEAIKTGQELRTILVRADRQEDYAELIDDACGLAADGTAAAAARTNAFSIAENLFDKLSQTETSQGIIASVRKQDFDKEDFLESTCGDSGESTSDGSSESGIDRGGNFLVLDRLQDPGNIGTIIRTADAAGYKLVIAMKGTADIYSPKTVRAATGSLFRMPVVFMDSSTELVEFTRAAGKKLVATCFDTDSYYFDEDLTEDIALVIGNEGNGISQEIIESSDLRIKIPMHGNIESLNASVAAGILMYETVRGRK